MVFGIPRTANDAPVWPAPERWMAAYRRMNMLAGIRGIQGRDRPSRGLSAPL